MGDISGHAQTARIVDYSMNAACPRTISSSSVCAAAKRRAEETCGAKLQRGGREKKCK